MAVAFSSLICYQDFKERMVHWFLFPLLGIALTLIFYKQTEHSFFLISLVTNVILITLIIGILYVYSRIIVKKRFINHSVGLGDILFFYALSVGFPPMTFIILFVCSLIFSLLTFLFLKKGMKLKTVPLAGLMSLFLIMVLLSDSFFEIASLYIL